MMSFFLLGITFGSGPCLASCGPLLITYTAGTNKGIKRSIITYLFFSLARICVYIVLGIAVYLLGRFIAYNFFHSFSRIILILGGAFIIFISVLMFLKQNNGFGYVGNVKKFFIKDEKKAASFFGLIIGLLPCMPLLGILSYAALISHSFFESFIFVLSFGIGTFISPLLILMLFSGYIGQRALKLKYYRFFNGVCALVMFILGVNLILRAF